LAAAINYANVIIIAVTAQAMAELSANIKKCRPKNKIFVLCMKGIDCVTHERLSEILRKNIDKTNRICVWVGPGHVQELTAGQPNIMVMAGDDKKTVTHIVKKFETDLIPMFENDDLIGVEVGSAAKNVMGIAAGMLDGYGMTSLKGALMARGCYEVSLLIDKMGGNKFTAFGMSHLGDFEATLFSVNSHNRRYGEEFVKAYSGGKSMDFEATAEGVATAKAMYEIAKKIGVVMPITNAIYSILYENADPKKVLWGLFVNMSIKEFSYSE
jgi:glycerol-3-phosphate dehydrogenase (NAD(P)+)